MVHQEPAILTSESQNGKFSAVSGLRLQTLMAPSALSISIDGRAVLSRSTPSNKLVRMLGQLASDGSFSLRYLFDPAQPGQLEIYLLFAVSASDRGQATKRASVLVQNLVAYFSIYHKGQRFAPIDDLDVLNRACKPFAPQSVLEVMRQEAELRIAAFEADIGGSTAPIGFAGDEPLKSKETFEISSPKESTELGAFSYFLPFLPTQDVMEAFCENLLFQPYPCMVEIAFKPYHLPPEARAKLEHCVKSCEDFLQGRWSQDLEVTVLEERARVLRKWFFAQQHALEAKGNAFLMFLLISSPNEIHPGLVSSFGEALTRPVEISAQNEAYLAGGFQVAKPDAALHQRSQVALNTLPFDRLHTLRSLFDSVSAGLVFRLPQATNETFPGLPVHKSRYLDAPEQLPTEGTRMGYVQRRGAEVPVALKTSDHQRHVYAIGQTGVGKSTLLLTMIMDHIRHGEGVGVIDPHGDLIQYILERIPAERHDDVILFDPGDADYPIGLNLLEWRLEEERAFLVDEMLAMLRMLYPPEMVGPVFEHNVRFGMLLLMASREHPGTLVEFPHLFSDPEFHKGWLPKVTDPLVKRFWEKEYPASQYNKDNYLHYIVSKFGPFITHPLMRNIIGQRRSSLDFEEIINTGKIFLVDLAKGKLGDLNSQLLGMIVVARLYSAAMRRIKIPRGKRKDFFVYVDEFQNLATQTFAGILSEARKFRLNLTLCNQYISQLPKGIINAILGNTGTLTVFRIGVQDAELLKDYFLPTLGSDALAGQPNGHAYVRLMVDGLLSTPFSMMTQPEPIVQGGDEARLRIIEQTRRRWARERTAVEREIRDALMHPRTKSTDSKEG